LEKVEVKAVAFQQDLGCLDEEGVSEDPAKVVEEVFFVHDISIACEALYANISTVSFQALKAGRRMLLPRHAMRDSTGKGSQANKAAV
jgi:hypothetical protein